MSKEKTIQKIEKWLSTNPSKSLRATQCYNIVEESNMSNFKELNERTINWAKEKGILDKATSLDQIEKTIEEVQETKEALEHQSKNLDTYINSKGKLCDTEDEVLDGFGDILVTILIGCKMQGIEPLDALETALNVIEKRTGKMINGQFVKDK